MKRILVTDDSMLMRSLIRNALKSAGFEVVGEATNGQEAIDLFAELKPDLVTMDLVMPVMPGVDAIREIRKKNPFSRILVITSLKDKDLASQLMNLGIDNCLIKPYKNEELVEKVNALLGLS